MLCWKQSSTVGRPGSAGPSSLDCYDIDVEIPLVACDTSGPVLEKLSKDREVEPVRH